MQIVVFTCVHYVSEGHPSLFIALKMYCNCIFLALRVFWGKLLGASPTQIARIFPYRISTQLRSSVVNCVQTVSVHNLPFGH